MSFVPNFTEGSTCSEFLNRKYCAVNGSLTFLFRRVVASITALSFALQPILTPIAAAQQITDPRAPIQFRPSAAVSGNGTAVVNITTPSFGGISHNKFERYNVDTRGVILNNSGYNGTSIIGGAVTANPNLVGRPTARVILNEVTGTTATTLNGPTEVFGTRADVIVANPNGVGCIGCTFINAGSITLSTGVPNPDYTLGSVRYSVTGGTVSLSGRCLKGGNGGNLGNIDLIGSQIRVEGPLEARGAVRLRAGAIDYDQGMDSVTALAGGHLRKVLEWRVFLEIILSCQRLMAFVRNFPEGSRSSSARWRFSPASRYPTHANRRTRTLASATGAR